MNKLLGGIFTVFMLIGCSANYSSSNSQVFSSSFVTSSSKNQISTKVDNSISATTNSTAIRTSTSSFIRPNLIDMEKSANLQCDRAAPGINSEYGYNNCKNANVNGSDDNRKGSWFNNTVGWWVVYNYSGYNVEIFSEDIFTGRYDWEVQLNFPLLLTSGATYCLKYKLLSQVNVGYVYVKDETIEIEVLDATIANPDLRGKQSMTLSYPPLAENEQPKEYTHYFIAPFSDTYISFLLGGRGASYYYFTEFELVCLD